MRQNELNNFARTRSRKRLAKTVLIAMVVVLFLGGIVWSAITNSRKDAAANAKPGAGDIAPGLDLPASTGQNISLVDYKGRNNVLLYFHEGLSCEPCIQQIPELEKLSRELHTLNVAQLNIALDPIDQQKQIIDRYNIKTPLLSYEAGKTEIDYNLLPFSMAMGRRAGHTFILVDPDGIIKWRKDYWPDYGMMVSRGTMFVQGEEILNEVKAVLGK